MGWVFEWIEEWSQIAPGYNWRTFHPIMIEFEDDRYMGAWECQLIVLGLGFRLRCNHTETEALKEIQEQVEDIKCGGLPKWRD